MEGAGEAQRLEDKTSDEVSRYQLELTGLKPGMTVLDAGAGTGAVARVMADIVGPTGRVVALDCSHERLAAGEVIAKSTGHDSIEFQAGDIYSLPFPVATFDFVWSRFVLEYLERPETAVHELAKVVKPGGTLVVGDADGHAAFHEGLDEEVEQALQRLLRALDGSFDPFAGRKLFGWCRKASLRDVRVLCLPHHMYAGAIPEEDLRNWEHKFQNVRLHGAKLLGSVERYDRLLGKYLDFLKDPDTFSYSILFLVSGTKTVT